MSNAGVFATNLCSTSSAGICGAVIGYRAESSNVQSSLTARFRANVAGNYRVCARASASITSTNITWRSYTKLPTVVVKGIGLDTLLNHDTVRMRYNAHTSTRRHHQRLLHARQTRSLAVSP